MPLPEQSKVRSSQMSPQTGTRVPTMVQKRISTDITTSIKGKTGIRSVSNTSNLKKFSGRQKNSTSQTKKSNATTENTVKKNSNHPKISPPSEFGLTRLLAAASAAVAVSPGVMRRGTHDPISTDTNKNAETSQDAIAVNTTKETSRNSDTKSINVCDQKYNTFARAMEMLPSFDDTDEDDEIEVPEILRDIPEDEGESLESIKEAKNIETFSKNIINQTPETKEKCKVIESKMLQNRRHYKKDSRFVLDLYTLTFDEDESVESNDNRGPVLTENSVYVEERNNTTDKIKLDLAKIHLKENSSYVSAKNNYFDFPSLEDYLMDYMSSKSSSSIPDETSHSSSSNNDLSKSEMTIEEDGNDHIRSLSGIRFAGPQPMTNSISSKSYSGPKSLPYGSQHNERDILPNKTQIYKNKITSIPCLETNLHKILARKFAESNPSTSSNLEELSFKKAKLLTKAYYRLLRSDSDAVLQYYQSSGELNNSVRPKHLARTYSSLATIAPTLSPTLSNSGMKHKSSHPQSTTGSMVKPSDRLKWKALISAGNEELNRIVSGLSNTAQALNGYLVDMLLEKDGLLNKQDEMLEKISELADELLD